MNGQKKEKNGFGRHFCWVLPLYLSTAHSFSEEFNLSLLDLHFHQVMGIMLEKPVIY